MESPQPAKGFGKKDTDKVKTVTLNQFNISKRTALAVPEQQEMPSITMTQLPKHFYKGKKLKLNTESSEDLNSLGNVTFNDGGRNSPDRALFNVEGVQNVNMSWDSDDGKYKPNSMAKTFSSFSPVKNKNGTESILMEIVY